MLPLPLCLSSPRGLRASADFDLARSFSILPSVLVGPCALGFGLISVGSSSLLGVFSRPTSSHMRTGRARRCPRDLADAGKAGESESTVSGSLRLSVAAAGRFGKWSTMGHRGRRRQGFLCRMRRRLRR